MNMVDRLSAAEMSALFSNLSKGCEKQYRPEEAALFKELSEYYGKKPEEPENPEFKAIYDLLQKDLNEYPKAKETLSVAGDRGGLRALVWGEKVSRMSASLIMRYMKDGGNLLLNTNLHVCEVCGFIYMGDEPPEVCPVCKVPRFRIRKIKRR